MEADTVFLKEYDFSNIDNCSFEDLEKMMQELATWSDIEVAHMYADDILYKLVKDQGYRYERILKAYENVGKWYA
jgi:hypothetical protein